MNRTMVYVGLAFIVAGVTVSEWVDAAVTTASHATYAFKPCSRCAEVSYPTEQQCRDAAFAEAQRIGATREIGHAVYPCITRFNVIATFKANPPPPPTPVDCVVSEWGAWSDPPFQACAGTQQTRALVRTRAIVTQPANGGAACPGLVETRTETRQCPGIAILSWTPPTRNTNGTSLTNLAGYRVHYGLSEAELTQSVQIANPGISSYTITDLLSGTWFFAVRAYTSGGTESANSNVQSKVVE